MAGLVVACMHGGATPKPGVGGTLALPGEAAPRDKPQGPLKVAFAAPAGSAAIVSEISVVFDRPVQPLGVVTDAAAPFRLTPATAGAFRWVGSRAVVFTPERRLPLATRFEVEVPAGLKALDGTQLQNAYRFELTTRRPKLVSSLPHNGERGLAGNTEIRLELNQSVTPATLRAAVKLEAKGSRTRDLAFDVVALEKQPRALLVKPRQPLPAHSAISLTMAASLRGSEGPLEAGAAQSLTFHTYEPLALLELSCARE
ncbi:MAG TPA: Ig-like domain-containing protein, partial [Polyangiaceae bacterium]|nr:Ig-like domain-containing protein [Polyangiaceae bacterium]